MAVLKRIERRNVAQDVLDSNVLKALEDKAPSPAAAEYMQKILAARGIYEQQDLAFSLQHLLPYHDLKGIHTAAQLLVHAIQQNQSILILGDYDADGATAATIAILALRQMGARHIDYLVPNRFDYGYGLSPEIAKVALSRQPDLVITVDNGISSVKGVQMLRDAGIEVLITDHHLPAEQLPNASAIVNPSQPGCSFESKALAGVGVMFYVLMALRQELIKLQWFDDKPPNLAQYLDLVALGTVADVVPLDRNNRILVAQGIARIRAGKCCPGIRALLQTAGRAYDNIVAQDLGFVVAPRLNAAGRLEDIAVGIECLLSSRIDKAMVYAQDLEQTNAQRKAIEQQMQKEALADVNALDLSEIHSENQTVKGICLFKPDWHQGVTGLIASRIKEQFAQPSIVFAKTSSGELTGSARSIKGLHIKDLLEYIAQRQPDLILKFGGHAMAAGLTIEEHKLASFKKAFSSAVQEFCVGQKAGHIIFSDGQPPADLMSLNTAHYFKHACPWGQGIDAPLFDAKFEVVWCKIVGAQHLKMQLRNLLDNNVYDAIAFRVVNEGEAMPELDQIHAVFALDVNEFRGKQSLQLLIEYFIPIVSDQNGSVS